MADLIDRNALRRDIDELCRLTGFDTPVTAIYCVKRVIEKQPNIDPESLRPVGRWDDNGERDKNGVMKPFAIRCSVCGSSAGTSWMKYCPNCGAKMVDASDGGAER